MVDVTPTVEARSSRAPFLKLLVLAGIVIGGVLAVRLTPLGDVLTRDGIQTGIELLRSTAWAPVLFVVIYAVATALAIPGTILTLAGGALFGVGWGTLLNWIAANLGANLAFGEARALGRDGLKRLLGDRADFLERASRDHGFQALLTLRLIPLVPFNALNFGSGLTGISWPGYALATAVGILPGTAVYTFFADALLQGSQEASRSAFIRVAVAGALMILLSFLPYLLKRLNVKLPGTASLIAALFVCGSALSAQDSAIETGATPSIESDFTELLADIVDVPRVDYAALKERRSELDSVLEAMGRVSESALAEEPDAERLAFWINAYNACMLRRVIDHYPIMKSGGLIGRIKNVFADRPDNSVWQIEDVFTGKHCFVAGAVRSQDEIEHEIIRPIGDPRIHFVVNCAARSCPSLAPFAYRADNLDEQLDQAVRSFILDQRHFAVESGEPTTVHLNKVLDWYQDDFGGVSGLVEFLAEYVDDDTAALLRADGTRVEFFDYDWTLNDTGTR